MKEREFVWCGANYQAVKLPRFYAPGSFWVVYRLVDDGFLTMTREHVSHFDTLALIKGHFKGAKWGI